MDPFSGPNNHALIFDDNRLVQYGSQNVDQLIMSCQGKNDFRVKKSGSVKSAREFMRMDVLDNTYSTLYFLI